MLARYRRVRWVITEHYNGRPARWFRYHPHHVYTWTKHPDRATVFRSEDDAHHAAQSCEICWRYRYIVERHR